MLQKIDPTTIQRTLQVTGRAVLAFAAGALFIALSWEPEPSRPDRLDAALHRIALSSPDALTVVAADFARPWMQAPAAQATNTRDAALARSREESALTWVRLGGVRANSVDAISLGKDPSSISEHFDVSTESHSSRGPP